MKKLSERSKFSLDIADSRAEDSQAAWFELQSKRALLVELIVDSEDFCTNSGNEKPIRPANPDVDDPK